MAQLRMRNNFIDDDSDSSFNLEYELQKLRSINSQRNQPNESDTLYYFSGSKIGKHQSTRSHDGNGNLSTAFADVYNVDHIDKDQQRRIRNQMLLAKIQQLEMNLSSETLARQNKLETMKREYEALLRKYRPGRLHNLSRIKFNTSTSSSGSVSQSRTMPNELYVTSTAVNTILTGPVKPIQAEDMVPNTNPKPNALNFEDMKEGSLIHQDDQFSVIADLDENQKAKYLSTLSTEERMPFGNSNLLTTASLFFQTPRPPTIFTSSVDSYQNETSEFQAFDNFTRFKPFHSKEEEKEGNVSKQSNKDTKDNQQNFSSKLGLLEDLSTTTSESTDKHAYPGTSSSKPTKSNFLHPPNNIEVSTDDDDETNTTTSFSIAKNNNKVESKILPKNLSPTEEDLSLNSSASSSSSSSTTTTVSSYDLLKKANMKSGVNLLGENANNLFSSHIKPASVVPAAALNTSLSTHMILNGRKGSQTLNEVIKNDESGENGITGIKESGKYDKRNEIEATKPAEHPSAAAAGALVFDEDDTQNSFGGESLEGEVEDDEEEEKVQEVNSENVLGELEKEKDEEQFKRKLINDNKENFTGFDKKVQKHQQPPEIHDLSSLRLRDDDDDDENPAAEDEKIAWDEGNATETLQKEKKVSSGDETAVAAKLFTKELEQQKKELGEIKLVEKESDNILHFDGIKSNSNVRSEKRMSEEMKTESQDAQNLVKLDKNINDDEQEKKAFPVGSSRVASKSLLSTVVPEEQPKNYTKSSDLMSNRHIRIKLDYEDSEESEASENAPRKVTTGTGRENDKKGDSSTLLATAATEKDTLITESDLAKMVESDFDDFFD